MPINTEVTKLIRAIGETPGYHISQHGDDFKAERLPFRGAPARSVKISLHVAEQGLRNVYTRVRRDLSWSWELHSRIQETLRHHRVENTDPTPDIERHLADVIPHQREPRTETTRPTTQRHAKGSTATGSAKTGKTTATPAGTFAEAPVQLLHDAPTTRAELISPERALDLLERIAPYQRPVRKSKVRDYAAAMVRGEWVLNPADPICIDTHNATANGQHRLEAVIESERPQPFLVAYGVNPDAYKHMDRGAKRTTGDMLYGAGEANANRLAGAAKLLYLWFHVDQAEWRKAPEVTEPQVFETLEEHPGLRESVRLGRIGGGMKISPTATIVTHYLISRRLGGDTRLPSAWFKAIAAVDLPRGTPGHALALYLLKQTDAARRRTELAGRSKRHLDMYLLLRAWNNSCAGRETRSVGWKPDFVIPQPQLPGPGHTLPDPG